MSKQANSRKMACAQPARPKPAAVLPRPGGKLGIIVDLLAKKGGASADQLVAGTGWQRHSVRGALSRLRARGFAMQLATNGENAPRVYQLEVRVARDAAP